MLKRFDGNNVKSGFLLKHHFTRKNTTIDKRIRRLRRLLLKIDV